MPRPKQPLKPIMDLLEKGLSSREISEQLYLPLHTIWRVLREAGISIRQFNYARHKGSLRVTPPELRERNERIVADIKTDMKMKDIAAKYGLTVSAVWKIGSLQGLCFSREANAERNSNIYRDQQKGMTVKDIALKYYLCETSIHKILERERKEQYRAEQRRQAFFNS